MSRQTWLHATFAGLLLTVATLAEPQTRTANPPRRILFIGNSLTYAQQGIYLHIQGMGAAAMPPLTIQADKAVVGGQVLQESLGTIPGTATGYRQGLRRGRASGGSARNNSCRLPSIRATVRCGNQADRGAARPVDGLGVQEAGMDLDV